MGKESLPRIDTSSDLYRKILPLCRLSAGEIWEDPQKGHRVGVIDATNENQVNALMGSRHADLMVHDPPYNFKVGSASTAQLFADGIESFLRFCRQWVSLSDRFLRPNGHFYVWLGADQRNGFQPLPEFMQMMREFSAFESRSMLTMRNQRGYGTSANWMSVRQELLYYRKGKPHFEVVYTEIPKKVAGYYKNVGGQRQENRERGKSPFIRAGNVWIDIQQVFYRMKENVPGAYAQKPLASILRILKTLGSGPSLVADFFAHSGTTLVAAERLGKTCYTGDLDPVFAELTIRRLEHLRKTGEPGWQWNNPFPEIHSGEEDV